MEEPVVRFHLDGGEVIESTWENTCIYEHHPQYEQFDHIFIANGEEENSIHLGTFIFRALLKEFDEHVEHMTELYYPYVFRPYPADCDVEAYLIHALKDLNNADHIPDDWA